MQRVHVNGCMSDSMRMSAGAYFHGRLFININNCRSCHRNRLFNIKSYVDSAALSLLFGDENGHGPAASYFV